MYSDKFWSSSLSLRWPPKPTTDIHIDFHSTPTDGDTDYGVKSFIINVEKDSTVSDVKVDIELETGISYWEQLLFLKTDKETRFFGDLRESLEPLLSLGTEPVRLDLYLQLNPRPRMLTINVTTTDMPSGGGSISIDIGSDEYVKQLKKLIGEKMEIPPDRQRLLADVDRPMISSLIVPLQDHFKLEDVLPNQEAYRIQLLKLETVRVSWKEREESFLVNIGEDTLDDLKRLIRKIEGWGDDFPTDFVLEAGYKMRLCNGARTLASYRVEPDQTFRILKSE